MGRVWSDGFGGLPLNASNLNAMEADIAAAKAGTGAPLWQAGTAYSAGQAVISPYGNLVTAVSAFTSGSTYNAANWVRSDRIVNVKDFGAKGDGVTDDTSALQTFVTYCINNNRRGYIPAGTYLVSSTINFTAKPNWGIEGAGKEATVISCATDNIAIFNLGSDTASYMHDIGISRMSFTYTSHAAGQTSANPILFSQMVYESVFRELGFDGGSYAIRVANGIGGPWGCTFDDLCFNGGLTGGAMDWSQCVNSVPNNRFGRMFVSAQNMQDSPSLAIFDVRGYNFVIDTIECISVNYGKSLLGLAAGSRLELGTIKIENGTYSQGGNVYLLDIGKGSHAWASIGHFTVSGDTSPSPTLAISNSTNVYAIRNSGDGVECDFLDIGASAAIPSGSGLWASNANNDGTTFGNVKSSSGYWSGLTNNGSTGAADWTKVKAYVNDRLSQNKGDAAYTVALGDPNVISYETALTAARAITLPSDNTKLCNGLYYEVRVYGAAPSTTNPLTVVCNGVTLATITTDKVVYRWTWRRVANPTGGGWVNTKYETLP